MIEGSLYPNQGIVFGSILLSVVVVICCQLLFWRPPEKTKFRRPFTLRIEEVPINKSSNDLQCDLISIITGDSNLKQDAITIEIHSIVPKDQRIAYATATFDTSIPSNEMMKRLRIAGASLPYRFDDKFHGITPLYEASKDVDVE